MFKRIKMVLILGVSMFSAAAEESGKPVSAFRFGGDERIRQEYFDNAPAKNDLSGYARGGENNYFRFRTRLWSEWNPASDWTFRMRVSNEIRSWMEPDVDSRPERSTYEYPDDLIFDNLYIERRNLLNGDVDLRIGRQDLVYGRGKVMADGTPGDGSRTGFYNALKTVWRINEKNTLDFFCVYNKSDDDLAINSTERDLNIYPKAMDGVTESGAGIYLKNASFENNPFEAYLIYKRESEYDERTATNVRTYAWQELDSVNHLLTTPRLDLYTLGGRWMPQWTDSFSGNMELAFQVGERGDEQVTGWMADIFMKNMFLSGTRFKPAVEYGVYALSGNKTDTDKDESWNPLWSRTPQISEVYVFNYDTEQSAARWSNLFAPHVDLTACNLIFSTKTTLACYYLRAFEADGAGEGKNRGMLYVLKNEFVLGENLLLEKDKLTGHLWVEVIDPGNYHTRDETGAFIRGELMYSF